MNANDDNELTDGELLQQVVQTLREHGCTHPELEVMTRRVPTWVSRNVLTSNDKLLDSLVAALNNGAEIVR